LAREVAGAEKAQEAQEERRNTGTPLWRAYSAVKAQYPDTLLFYRIGDFYELFGADAETASKELDLTLTGRDIGLSERVPMCGVPHHALDAYLDR
jgi:DNA mismatch repair protein MutS